MYSSLVDNNSGVTIKSVNRIKVDDESDSVLENFILDSGFTYNYKYRYDI
jgi:hypothetical protein